MANYKNLEYEFVERTLALISQYEIKMHNYVFEEQYNHTLIINCLLGIIVLPKEKIIQFIPNVRITNELKKMIGIPNSTINKEIKNLRQLIIELRNSIAHFDICVESINDKGLIDQIIFRKHDSIEIICFQANELLPFVRYYSTWLLSNLNKYNNDVHT